FDLFDPVLLDPRGLIARHLRLTGNEPSSVHTHDVWDSIHLVSRPPHFETERPPITPSLHNLLREPSLRLCHSHPSTEKGTDDHTITGPLSYCCQLSVIQVFEVIEVDLIVLFLFRLGLLLLAGLLGRGLLLGLLFLSLFLFLRDIIVIFVL